MTTDEPTFDGPLAMPVNDRDCDLPRCHCGQAIRFAGCNRCEDCVAADSARFHGNDQLVKTLIQQMKHLAAWLIGLMLVAALSLDVAGPELVGGRISLANAASIISDAQFEHLHKAESATLNYIPPVEMREWFYNHGNADENGQYDRDQWGRPIGRLRAMLARYGRRAQQQPQSRDVVLGYALRPEDSRPERGRPCRRLLPRAWNQDLQHHGPHDQ
jgi:hypothetical protein